MHLLDAQSLCFAFLMVLVQVKTVGGVLTDSYTFSSLISFEGCFGVCVYLICLSVSLWLSFSS